MHTAHHPTQFLRRIPHYFVDFQLLTLLCPSQYHRHCGHHSMQFLLLNLLCWIKHRMLRSVQSSPSRFGCLGMEFTVEMFNERHDGSQEWRNRMAAISVSSYSK